MVVKGRFTTVVAPNLPASRTKTRGAVNNTSGVALRSNLTSSRPAAWLRCSRNPFLPSESTAKPLLLEPAGSRVAADPRHKRPTEEVDKVVDNSLPLPGDRGICAAGRRVCLKNRRSH
jgi:hypothetical protein